MLQQPGPLVIAGAVEQIEDVVLLLRVVPGGQIDIGGLLHLPLVGGVGLGPVGELLHRSPLLTGLGKPVGHRPDIPSHSLGAPAGSRAALPEGQAAHQHHRQSRRRPDVRTAGRGLLAELKHRTGHGGDQGDAGLDKEAQVEEGGLQIVGGDAQHQRRHGHRQQQSGQAALPGEQAQEQQQHLN